MNGSPSTREILQLYERGLYLQAYEKAKAWGSFSAIEEPERKVMAGRLAVQLGGRRLGTSLHLRAARQAPDDLEANYYAAHAILQRRGPYFALKLLARDPQEMESRSSRQAADWYTLRGESWAMLRDFDAAEAAQSDAERLSPDNEWVLVSRAFVLEQQDRYEEALTASRRALELHPLYRPAVQQAAHLMVLVGKDDEAMRLLAVASERLEVGVVDAQLSILLSEHGRYDDVWRHLDRYEARSPIIEKNETEWLAGRRADTAYYLGRLDEALEHARRVPGPFYEDFAEKLSQASGSNGKRLRLEVAFVRQHHMTCAPATLSALCRFWSMPADHLELAEEICYDGTPAHSERNWAETHGWFVKEFTVTWESAVALLDAGIPFTFTTVEPASAHLQSVIGYDSLRQTFLIRDPYVRSQGELRVKEGLDHYAFTGPRGMALVPEARAEALRGILLPDEKEYDLYHRFQLCLDEHYRKTAERVLRELSRLSPDHRLAHEAKLSLADYDGDAEGRLAAMEALAGQYPHAQAFALRLLGCLQMAGREDQRLALLRSMTLKSEIDPVFLQLHAELLGRDHRELPEANRLLRRAIRMQPTEAEHYSQLAHLLWESRAFEDGLGLYRIATCLSDRNEDYAHAYFIASRHFKRADEALAFLQGRFGRFGAKSGLPARTLFKALDDLDRVDDGLAALDRALQKRPDDADLALFCAVQFSRYGHEDRAESLLQKVKLRTRRVDWLRAEATLAEHRGEMKKALELWRKVLVSEPIALDAHRSLVALLHDQEGPEAAEEHLLRVIDKFSHNHTLSQLAVSWLGDSKPETSIEILERLVETSPTDTWSRRELVRNLVGLDRYEEAEAHIRIALEHEPLSTTNHIFRGHVFLVQDKIEPAREWFQKALKLSVDAEDAVALLMTSCVTPTERREALDFIRSELVRQVIFGDGLLAFRDHANGVLESSEILDVLSEAHRARPDLWHTWSALVSQLTEMDRLDEARELASRTAERFPLLPRVWIDLATVHRKAADASAEIEALREALAINPSWSPAIRELADACLRSGDFTQARQILERSVERSPRDADLRKQLADILWGLNEREAALDTIREAVLIEPTDEAAWDSFRDWALALGRAESVVALARDVAPAKPGRASTWYILAKVMIGFEELDERLKALDRAIAIEKRYIDAYDLKAQLLTEAQHFEQAIVACREDVWGEAIPVTLLGRAAWVAAQRGNVEEAIHQMRQAVGIDPFYHWGWMQLAEWYNKLDNVQGYLDAATRLAELGPNVPLALGYLADAKRCNGEIDEAKSLLHRAMDLAPDYVFAGISLFNLYRQEGEVGQAREVLNRVAPYLPDAEEAVMAIELDVPPGYFEKARENLTCLLENHEASVQHFARAQEVWAAAKHAKEFEWIALKALGGGANPEVGQAMVQPLVDGRDWKAAHRLLGKLGPGEPAWQMASVTYLNGMADNGARGDFVSFVEANSEELRAHDDLWGTVAYGLVSFNEYRRVLSWLKDWRSRAGAEPWMMVNFVISLSYLGRWKEAAAVSRKMVQAQPDHTTGIHELLLAFAEACDGDVGAATRRLSRVNSEQLGDYYRFVHLLTQCVVSMGNGAPSFTDARELLREARALTPAYKNDKILKTFYCRAVKRIARLQGGVGAYAWSLGELFRANA